MGSPVQARNEESEGRTVRLSYPWCAQVPLHSTTWSLPSSWMLCRRWWWKHSCFPKWAPENHSEAAGGLPLLLGTGLGSSSFTALTASWAPTQPCLVLHPALPIPKCHSPCGLGPQAVLWTQSSRKSGEHGNKYPCCPAICAPLLGTAAKLPACSSLPEAPNCPLPKPTLLDFTGQWLLDIEARVLPAALKSTNWKRNLYLGAEQLWLMKYSMQKPLPFFLKSNDTWHMQLAAYKSPLVHRF